MTTIEEWNQIYAGYGLPFNQELHDRIRQEAASELSALQKENDKLRLRLEIFESGDHADGVVALCNTSVDLEYERDSLRTQNRELREMCKVKDEALVLVLDHPVVTAEELFRCRQALALQPEK